MPVLSLPVVLLLSALCLAAGAVAGYFACYRRQQQHGGGRTAAELRADLEDYRERVAASFERSAVLFHELDSRHRELYRHLAVGAATLAPAAGGRPRLEFAELARLAPPADDPAGEPAAPVGAVVRTAYTMPSGDEPADDVPARQTGPG